jgi:Ca-activated chloride channel family protein
MMSLISLAHPWVLLAALALPMLEFLRRRRRRPALGVADGEAALAAASSPGWAFTVPLCRHLGLCLLACALAGPELRPESATYTGRGLDIMLAVDVSESMAAMDFKAADRSVTRLEAVAEAARSFAAARPGDRIGLIAFGSRAYTVIPPTADRTALNQALSRLDVGAAGKRTAMGDGLGLAVKRLRQTTGLSRVAAVFSDGRSNAGEISPETAALAAVDHKVRVYAVGVGGDEPAPFLVNHPLLGREIIYEKATVDEKTLSDIARTTGGAYFRAGDAAGLAQALAALDGLEKSDMTVAATTGGVSLAGLCIALAVCALTAYAALANTRFVRLP